jgi:polygalacturonase
MNPRLLPLFAAAALLAGCATHQVRSSAIWPPDVAPAQPIIPVHAFSLMDFGAVPDGATSNTGAFRRAVAAVAAAGGGRLEVPAGVYFTGPISLCSGINLHLAAGAIIRFSPRTEDYGSGGGRLRQLTVTSAHDVLISGSGTIDGHGEAWWATANALRDPVTGKPFTNVRHPPRPSLLVFTGCQRIRVEGISLINSPTLNLGTYGCDDVTIEGITLLNPPDSPNTDGIDPQGGSRRILIAHCRIDTGDDDICLKGSVQDMLVTDCAILHGHGISIGSNVDRISNLTVRRCTFDGTATGVRIKSGPGRGGLAENLTYEDLTMRDVSAAITLNSHYQDTTVDTGGIGIAHIPTGAVTSRTPQWRHIVIRRVTATGCTQSAGIIVGLPEMPAEDISLDHVAIDAPLGLRIGYAKNITLHDVRIHAASGPALTVADTVQDLKNQAR